MYACRGITRSRTAKWTCCTWLILVFSVHDNYARRDANQYATPLAITGGLYSGLKFEILVLVVFGRLTFHVQSASNPGQQPTQHHRRLRCLLASLIWTTILSGIENSVKRFWGSSRVQLAGTGCRYVRDHIGRIGILQDAIAYSVARNSLHNKSLA